MTAVLGIETSCDETAAAVVEEGRTVRSNLVATQHDLHARYGGVVPEIASRAHIERLDALIVEALRIAGRSPRQIDLLAVTSRPGLIGSLLVGVTAAKTLAWSWGKPLVGVDHVQAHAASPAIDLDASPWPAVALVVSGGHTSLLHVRDFHDMRPLGATTDDAAGEAFDKVAAILQLGYPGGPFVDDLSQRGNPARFDFPRTRLAPGSLDFSFSGIKTAVLYRVHGPGRTSGGLKRLGPQDVADLCAGFSAAVVDVLVQKTLQAAADCRVANVVVGGGVAANTMLRRRLTDACRERMLDLHLAAPQYCTDNAAMIAALGHHLHRHGRTDDLRLAAASTS